MADKGFVTVAISKVDYKINILAILFDVNSYRELHSNPMKDLCLETTLEY